MKQTHIGMILAASLLSLVLVVVAIAPAAGALTTDTITLDDPANETVEVDLDFSGSTSATVALEDSDGSVVTSETLSGASGDTLTASLSAGYATPGNYTLNVTATDETVVSLNETRLTDTETVEVTDAGNETLAVEAGFEGSENATATVSIENESGSEILTDSIQYVADGGNETTIGAEYNGSDLVTGNLTVSITTTPATAYTGGWATIADDTGQGAGAIIPEGGPSIPEAVGLVALIGLLGLFGLRSNRGD
ncbi:hypothetical protein Huta_0798 [Halorhabdus utahensis DSM 12940]|uniref:Uncharacterized protein n=1 Tax=Halorhabdus utahensis (strain DSM 12940 / JCM 11049 / AX-2) TaxID=519442 RepID=C7NU86_HALUD|nr:hypothetical protein [Halorhabdus utahensis]ACV10983.1 hypothetical protein Huta_0798 [Halorhabdus utahensis DSM 12940]